MSDSVRQSALMKRDNRVHVRVDEKILAMIRREAKRMNTTASEAVRQMLYAQIRHIESARR